MKFFEMRVKFPVKNPEEVFLDSYRWCRRMLRQALRPPLLERNPDYHNARHQFRDFHFDNSENFDQTYPL